MRNRRAPPPPSSARPYAEPTTMLTIMTTSTADVTATKRQSRAAVNAMIEPNTRMKGVRMSTSRPSE